jgi:hypothetical protein
VYPLPAKIANLLKMQTMTKDDNVHPSLIEDASTESIMKLMKFGLWVDYQIKIKKSNNVKEVISKELEMYQNDLGILENITVT